MVLGSFYKAFIVIYIIYECPQPITGKINDVILEHIIYITL